VFSRLSTQTPAERKLARLLLCRKMGFNDRNGSGNGRLHFEQKLRKHLVILFQYDEGIKYKKRQHFSNFNDFSLFGLGRVVHLTDF